MDWAECVRVILDQVYPKATCIRLVQDNLNTHTIGSLYAAFAPEEARRLARRLEIHPTPVHASWLNMAETELSILERQCLDRRLEAAAVVRAEVGAWEAPRSRAKVTINWRFTVAEARVKLKSVYPSVADRQRIVELFPTAHRAAFVVPDRQRIVEFGGGGDRC